MLHPQGCPTVSHCSCEPLTRVATDSRVELTLLRALSMLPRPITHVTGVTWIFFFFFLRDKPSPRPTLASSPRPQTHLSQGEHSCHLETVTALCTGV